MKGVVIDTQVKHFMMMTKAEVIQVPQNHVIEDHTIGMLIQKTIVNP
jgi:hypothetical protein